MPVSNRLRLLLAGVALLLVAVAIAPLVMGRDRPVSVRMLYTSNTQGYLEACG